MAQSGIITSQKKSSLSAPTELANPEFREKFAVSQSLLSFEGVRHYIDEQVKREKEILKEEWRARRTEIVDDIAKSQLRGRIRARSGVLRSAVLVRVAGFLASTGQAALVDLTGQIKSSEEYGGFPVVYIDSMLCNTPDKCVQRHELDEVLQWEDLRVNVLHISDKKEMAKWIRAHIDSPDDNLKATEYEGLNARQIAKLFCSHSYPVRELYKKLNSAADLDYEYIKTMLQLYGADEASPSVNIASGPMDIANDGHAIFKDGSLKVVASDAQEFIFRYSRQEVGRDILKEYLIIDIFAEKDGKEIPIGYAHAGLFETASGDRKKYVSMRLAIVKNQLATAPSPPAIYIKSEYTSIYKGIGTTAMSLLLKIAQSKKAHSFVIEEVKTEENGNFYKGLGFTHYTKDGEYLEFSLMPDDMKAERLKFPQIGIETIGSPAPKLVSLAMYGKDSSKEYDPELEAGQMFREFATLVRLKLQDIRQNIADRRIDSISSDIKEIGMKLETFHQYKEPLLVSIYDRLADSMDSLYVASNNVALYKAYIRKNKNVEADNMLAYIEESVENFGKAILEEFEKLAQAHPFLEATSSIQQSAVSKEEFETAKITDVDVGDKHQDRMLGMLEGVLVLNCGSSSVKYQLFDMSTSTLVNIGGKPFKGMISNIGEDGSGIADHGQAIDSILDQLPSGISIAAVGHRVVHGGEKFKSSALITAEVEAAIRDCIPLAPLHNPANLAGIEACTRSPKLKDVPQVAVFDTTFHQTMPAQAYLYALPRQLIEKFGIRKYGFHGTSHKFVMLEAARILGIPVDAINAITCHLGNGASIAAIQSGRSIDTTMGFTPLEGIPMGTRSGDIDADIVKFLVSNGISIDEISRILNKLSGLLGLSGVSNDIRKIQEALGIRNDDDPQAAAQKITELAAQDADLMMKHSAEALLSFTYRIAKYIWAFYGILGGRVDAIVFTGGIGENAVIVRHLIQRHLLPEMIKNVKVIPTNEELMIARDTWDTVNGGKPTSAEVTLLKLPPNDYLGQQDVALAGCLTWQDEVTDDRIDDLARRLARTGIRAADEYASATKQTPRVAFLSYATLDAEGESERIYVKVIDRAAAIARKERPDITILGRGSLQFDAAIIQDIFKKKTKAAAGSQFEAANVFVFPSYHSYEICRDLIVNLKGDVDPEIFADKLDALQTVSMEPKHPLLKKLWGAIRQSARPPVIIFPESSPKVLKAVKSVARQGLATPVVVALPNDTNKDMLDSLREDGVEIIDPYSIIGQPKPGEAVKLDPCLKASRRLLSKRAGSGIVAGAESKTEDVITIAAFSKLSEYKGIYDYFAMLLPFKGLGDDGFLYFVGCGSLENPKADQLAEMAIASAASFENTSGKKAKIALLSSSKWGPDEKVAQALNIIRDRAAGLDVVGPVSVAEALKQGCNTLVFPDLSSGNIAYKLTERILGVRALGPILLGTKQPISDLSRGASSWDVLQVAALISAQLASAQPPAATPVAAKDQPVKDRDGSEPNPRPVPTLIPDLSPGGMSPDMNKSMPPATTLAAQNLPDIEVLQRILAELAPNNMEKRDGIKYYTVKYNTRKIPQNSSAEKLLKLYVEGVLPMYMPGKDRIKLIPSAAQRQSLISIECFGDRSRSVKIGEGRVDIEEDIGGKALRLIGMLNMALLASQIPSGTTSDEINKYDALISLIKSQYKDIAGKDMPPEILKDISRGVRIVLPRAAPVALDKTDEYYRLTIRQLEQAA